MTTTRLADYVAERIAQLGIEHVFLVTGGGAMHLDDAVGRRTDLRYVCNHHEQACAMAVEGYARVRGDIGAAIVTSGPGGTNAVTGVLVVGWFRRVTTSDPQNREDAYRSHHNDSWYKHRHFRRDD